MSTNKFQLLFEWKAKWLPGKTTVRDFVDSLGVAETRNDCPAILDKMLTEFRHLNDASRMSYVSSFLESRGAVDKPRRRIVVTPDVIIDITRDRLDRLEAQITQKSAELKDLKIRYEELLADWSQNH